MSEKKIRFKHHKPGPGGWSEWTCPDPDRNFLFKCCDCGLVHEMQFAPFAETNRKRGAFDIVRLPWPIRTMFRARRSRVKGT